MHRFALFLLMACSATAQTKVDLARVERLLERAVVIDLHDDTTQMILDEGYNLGEKHDYGQVDIPRMRAGHVSGLFLSLWIDSDRYTPAEAIRRTLQQIDAVRLEIARHPGDLEMATTSADILAARKRGHIAILMGVEGGIAIDSDLAVLRSYAELGVRYLTLTHTNHTPWADSASLAAEIGQPVVRARQTRRIGPGRMIGVGQREVSYTQLRV